LKDQLGAQPKLVINSIKGYDDLELARYRGRTARQITGCHACPLVGGTGHPVKFHGESGLEEGALIISEAPGEKETEQNRPFVGKSGKLLRAMLNKADLDPDNMVWTNTVQCWPREKGRTRTPMLAEIAACRDHVMNVRNIAQQRFIVLCGATALSLFRSDLKITKVRGKLYLWDETYWVLPIFHPAAALRNVGMKKPLQEDLFRLSGLLKGEISVWESLDHRCVRCDIPVHNMQRDRDAVPYCPDHYVRYMNNWQVERNRWEKRKEKGNAKWAEPELLPGILDG